ncbi:peptidylprolyl isomerase [Alteromonas sp. C1M14]|uniref:peptidylprolyl isomerase n=1 Tax=Alteromonas sp. C1M14 TaxID=2841567 RepID=UPI001C085ED0|nr:peptidylprolyl isomerase [Alteromonas sp. C1M14]MBU2979528.1 peptidylprolyl isomerase [Alteromonas sp. C1M14]
MKSEVTKIRFDTTMGAWTANLYRALAPKTVSYFINLINSGGLDNTSIYRIVTLDNQPASLEEKIEVIQGGQAIPTDSESCDFLSHESTNMTKILHSKYTLSMPRFDLNEVYRSFFITMGDYPCLDYLGNRHKDKQGFAAFGEITSGFESLDRIFSYAERSDILRNPIKLISVKVTQ